MRLLALALLAAPIFALSYAPYGEREFLSEGGRYRLVTSATKEHHLLFELRDKDRVLAQGSFPDPPEDAYVLATRPAAVLFGRYAQNDAGVCLVMLGAKGKALWKVRLDQLFAKAELKAFPDLMGNLTWWRAWWVDEPRGKVVLVARGGHLREVDLATGAIGKPSKEVVLAAFKVVGVRARALEVAAELIPLGLQAAAAPLAADARLDVGLRLRAAVAVRAAGGPAVAPELFEAAIAPARSSSEKQFALDMAARYMGEGAADFLEEATARKDLGYRAVIDLGKLGEPGARVLAGLLGDAGLASPLRAYASETLGRMQGEFLLPAILRELEEAKDDPEQAGLLLRAAIATRAPKLHASMQPYELALLAALDHETGPVGWLADHFRVYATSEAVKPLLKALARHRADPLAPRLIASLRRCTGRDLGDDPAAWLRGIRPR